MHAFIDQNTIIVSDQGKVVMVAAGDPAFNQVREYLTVQEGQDFDTVRSIVFMSRHLVDTFGWSESDTATVPWN